MNQAAPIDPDLLLRVYHGQGIPGSGVLMEDLQVPDAALAALVKKRWATVKSVGPHKFVIALPDGLLVARELATEKARAGKENLAAFIASKPPKIVTFLVTNYFRGGPTYLGSGPIRHGTSWNETFTKIPVVWGVRTDILRMMETLHLSSQFHHYYRVGDRVEVDQLRYVVPSESQSLLSELSPGQVLSDDEVKLAQLYYLVLKLGDLFSLVNPDTARFLFAEFQTQMSGLNPVIREWLRRFIGACSSEGLTSVYRPRTTNEPPFVVLDRLGYRSFADDRISKPLMDSMLGTRSAENLVEAIVPPDRKLRKKAGRVRSHWPAPEAATNAERLELFEKLQVFETRLRLLIIWKLSASLGGSWMDQLPGGLIETWVNRQADDERASRLPEPHLIYYADFGDYRRIIERFWTHVFMPVSPNKELVLQELTRLNNLGRKPLAHSRAILKDEIGSCNRALRIVGSMVDDMERGA